MVRAAEHLHITQPVISRSLQELEEILGVTLFERRPRGLTPTVFGDAFTSTPATSSPSSAWPAATWSELAEGRRGTVTVGTHLFGSNVLLPEAMAVQGGLAGGSRGGPDR